MVTLEKFLNLVLQYNPEEYEIIKKAYEYAEFMHKGQLRQNGDQYIEHPLNVAYTLAEMYADKDTVCAALLHDVIEDTKATKEDIAFEFNTTIANLVDGVTKIGRLKLIDNDERKSANSRKIIMSITEDVRIIIIKLSDRLHNMRTLQHKSDIKQKEIAIETMELFVPLAYYIGAYRIKSDLEDLSFRFLKPELYEDLCQKQELLQNDKNTIFQNMLVTIQKILNDNGIPNEIKYRVKNVYGIYKRLSEGKKMHDIHDLISLKIMVKEVYDCYHALGVIHSQYRPLNEKFKDYICNPKTNMYQSLHTTVFGPDDRLVQTQIRTYEMDKVASFGLTAHWNISKGEARNTMQIDLKNKFQFFRSLIEINSLFGDNQEFVNQVKSELFSEKVYVYTTTGKIIELPKGASTIDFAYRIHSEIGNTMVAAIVNDEYVPLDYVLKNKDRIRIITDDLSYGPRREWLSSIVTSTARRKIKEFNKQLN